MSNYIHKALLRLRDEGPKRPRIGICGNLEEFLDEMFEQDNHNDHNGHAESLVRNLMLYKGTHWPKHSGCNTYPVPHPEADPSYHSFREVTDLASEAYSTLRHHAWDTNHPYGKLRAEFVEFLIERTKPCMNAI